MPELDQAKVIIATSDEGLFTALTSVAQWDTQHQTHSIAQLWQEVGTGVLDPASHFVVLAGDLPEGDSAVAAALAAIPATARLFFAETRPGSWPDIEAQIQRRTGGIALDVTVLTGVSSDMAAQMVAAVQPAPVHTAPAAPGVQPAPAEYRGSHSLPSAVEPQPSVRPQAPSSVSQRSAVPMPSISAAPTATTPAPSFEEKVVDTPGTLAENFDPALLAAAPLPDQETIVVISSKGGAGKSTTAVTLGAAIKLGSRRAVQQGLAQREARVLIVDMDVRDGQLGTLVGLYTPTALNIRRAAHVNERAIRANILATGHLGVDVLLAPNRPRAADDVGPIFYRTLLRTLKSMYDVVILDCSVNYLDALFSGVAIPEASRILLVSTPFKTSVQGVSRAVAELTTPVEAGGLGVPRSKIGLVVNMATGNVDTDQGALVAATQSVHIVASIPAIDQHEMLEATNTSRMDKLLLNAKLGPAYFALARQCAPTFPLVAPDTAGLPAVHEGNQGGYPTQLPVQHEPSSRTPVEPIRVAPIHVPAEPEPVLTGGKRKGGLFKGRSR